MSLLLPESLSCAYGGGQAVTNRLLATQPGSCPLTVKCQGRPPDTLVPNGIQTEI